MLDRTPKYQRFFAELKRRHVFRVMAVYGIIGFVIMQIVDLAVPALLLPEWTYRLIALLLLVGFPVAVIITWAFEITPEGVRKTRSAPPEEIAAIVAQPASKRWPSGLLALVGITALVAGAWWIGRQTAPGVDTAAGNGGAAETRPTLAEVEDEAQPTLAVLPFVNMSADRDQEYFSDGMTEELLNTLVKIRELKVMARTSVFGFKGATPDVRAVGDSLGVEYLVEGSVRKSGDQLRITAQLIDTEDGSHLWSEQYDRQLDDVFAIQTEIAKAIAEELRIPLGLAEGERLVSPTQDLEAYDLYLIARARLRERGKSLREAVRLFEAAIAGDSSWAPAWAGLAEAHELRTYYPSSWEAWPTDTRTRLLVAAAHQSAAENAANRALQLDSGIASAWVALGSVHRNRRDWEQAEQAYLRAMKLDEENAEAHQQYSDMLYSMGRIAEGLGPALRAVRLDPAPIRFLNLSNVQWTDGRYQQALESIRKGLALDPSESVPYLSGQWYLLNLALERFDEAPRFGLPDREGRLAVTQSQHQQLVRAMRLGDIARFPPALARQWHLVLVTWRSFSAPESALTAIERLHAEYPYENLSWLWIPLLDPIRDEARYHSLLDEVNLAGATPARSSSFGGPADSMKFGEL